MESAVTHRDLLTDYAIDKDIKYNEVHYQESWKGALGILTKADRVKSQVVLIWAVSDGSNNYATTLYQSYDI